ncbi:hypothetical protein [Halomonas cupida]|uniref:hypothetical protein n=1 Tax=Halomonas cupida TaxID=44933 RepID=UPI003A93AA9C
MGTVGKLHPEFANSSIDGHTVALAQLFRDRSLCRRQALENCVEHLRTAASMTQANAELTAVQAYADLTSTNCSAHIDVDATTSHVVVIRLREGQTAAFTISDLISALESARREQRTIEVNQRH